MIHLYNPIQAEGKKQLNFLKDIYPEIILSYSLNMLVEKTKNDSSNLILIDGINFDTIYKELGEIQNFYFLIFPPFPSFLSMQDSVIKFHEKEKSKNKISLQNHKLIEIFNEDQIYEEDIKYFYSQKIEITDKSKILIKDDVNNIFIVFFLENSNVKFFITTIIVDQFSIMNELKFINILNLFIYKIYNQFIESLSFIQKEKELKEKEISQKKKFQLFQLIILTLYFIANKEDAICIDSDEFWGYIESINEESFKLKLNQVNKMKCIKLVIIKELISKNDDVICLNTEKINNEFKTHHLFSIYRRLQVI